MEKPGGSGIVAAKGMLGIDMRRMIAATLSVAGALGGCARGQTTGVKLQAQNAAKALPPAAGVSGGPGVNVGCCGQQMTLLGQATVYQVPDGKAADGTAVPSDLQTEVYGEELQAKVELPPGTYTVEVTGSENSLDKAGERIFSVEAFSGNVPVKAGTGTMLAKDVDLLALAGGEGKAYVIKGTVKHAGGPLRIVFSASADNAKFSSIRVLDGQGNKAAWLFAQDVAEMLKLPDTPPVVAGPMIWKDATQPMEKRVADLIKRMTLKEKVRQIEFNAPSIDRLGLPSYNYWSECLHGVARNGYATVFPQAIGMSATWDPASLQTVGDVIATEARAKFNAWQADGGFDLYGGYYRGLTFWSPNINLFRDPRWGRGQETYGEDPFLTGTMGVAFIKGLQGNDPKYLKVVATAKHFAVHSGPESERHVFNAAPPLRDFYESYLPHFEMAVKEGHVYSVMGAYNRVYGSPACESDLLLGTILRRDWGFQGYVVSDCGAIDDIWRNHSVEQDRAAAAAGAVLAGCDLECGAGGADYPSLPLAVDRNLIGEGVIDQALGRVLLSRFKLGLFDPPAQVRYASIMPSENVTPAHDALALKMAHESMVLLKNDGVLPLAKTAKKIAIVGPNADGRLPLVGNYNGTPVAPVTVIEGIKNAFGGQIVYVRGCDNAPRDGDWQLVPDVCLRPAAGSAETGLKAEHFDNIELSGKPVTVRAEKQVDFHGMIEWTISGLPTVTSSSRWSGEFVAPADGEYHLAAIGTSAFRLTIAGVKVTDEWGDTSPADDTAADATGTATATAPATQAASEGPGQIVLKMKAGQSVPVVLECRQMSGFLDLKFLWDRGDLDLSKLAADKVKDADIIVFVGGLDGRMEAEEGDVRGTFKGFTSGDRDAIEMPDCQTAMLKALVATGKPVVLVNMTGSATAMPWAAEHVNAILQAWYPGEAGGTAVADVLFGAYNPSGRLPVTFYRATTDLPAFEDYAMKGRTYRYFTGRPLWAFGYGLSYTSFDYSGVAVDKPEVSAGDTVKVSVDVANTGTRDGEEVVQVYAKPVTPGEGDALERLAGFKRIALSRGEKKHVEIAVPVALLRNWDVSKKTYVVPAGKYELHIGGNSAEMREKATLAVK